MVSFIFLLPLDSFLLRHTMIQMLCVGQVKSDFKETLLFKRVLVQEQRTSFTV